MTERTNKPKIRRKLDANGLYDDGIFAARFSANLQGHGFVSEDGKCNFVCRFEEAATRTLEQLKVIVGKRRAKLLYRNWEKNGGILMEK